MKELSHFSVRLSFQHFRRLKGAESGLYVDFEDDFVILAIDFQLNSMIVGCQFDFRQRDLSSVISATGGFLLDQKVIAWTVRAYFELSSSEN